MRDAIKAPTMPLDARLNRNEQGSHVVRLRFAAVGCTPTGKQNGNYRHGKRAREVIQAVRYINLLSRLARRS